MSLDSDSAKLSVVNLMLPWRGIGIFPSETIDEATQRAVPAASGFAGFAIAEDLPPDSDTGLHPSEVLVWFLYRTVEVEFPQPHLPAVEFELKYQGVTLELGIEDG